MQKLLFVSEDNSGDRTHKKDIKNVQKIDEILSPSFSNPQLGPLYIKQVFSKHHSIFRCERGRPHLPQGVPGWHSNLHTTFCQLLCL